MTLPFQHPFTLICAGPTQAGKLYNFTVLSAFFKSISFLRPLLFVGKTTWIKTLLTHRDSMITPAPEKVYFCYSEWQQTYSEIGDVEWHEGPITPEILDPNIRNLVVYDDLIHQMDDSMCAMFTKISHHRNCDVIFITQNLFQQAKQSRTMSLNSAYFVLFKNPRDITQINYLARQMYPKNSKFLQEAYQDATSKPHGYLLIDCKQFTPEEMRIRTNIFPGEHTVVYLKRR